MFKRWRYEERTLGVVWAALDARRCSLAFYETTDRSHVIATRSAAVMDEMTEWGEVECGISMGIGRLEGPG